jgi:nucleoside-diphosphate-sugar epimerase/glycosyltransferase involved in cell wall biosynthesis
LRPTGIIAFAKDWHEDPTSNHHVLRELAKTRRVLWLNSVGTRAPKLSSGRDLGKIRRKLGEFTRGPLNVENDLWIFSPLVLPFPHSTVARRANREVLRATIRGLRWKLGMDRFDLWTFLPNVADYVGSLGESRAVYYCVDEWSMFAYLDREETVAAERALLAKVDCVFAINQALADAKRAHNPRTWIAPHGVDHALFARALDEATVVPEDIARLPRPVIGFYGTLRDWVDLDIIAHVARARPAWSIALIGQQLDDVGPIAGLSNVHLLGRKPHEALPAYCKGMDVGLIPYRIDERMKFVNPIKLREYLSAGLPVVSTDVPEVRRYERWCAIAHDGPGFVAAIERALAEDSPARRHERSDAMKSETWPARVAEVARIVDDLGRTDARHEPPLARAALSPTIPFVVTGASGSLGSAVVRRLLAEGNKLRVFMRRAPEIPIEGVEYAFGDLADPIAVERAIAGAETVIHVGASTKGTWPEHRAGTVVGTQNVIDACKKHDVKQLVHISSMSVVDWAGSAGKGAIAENAALEPRADERGAYTRAKLEAERKVASAAAAGLPCVILRPGQIFGGGIPLVNGAIARHAAGRWLVLGDGKLELPLVYIDDVVDAVLAAVAKRLTHGEVIQIIDGEHLTQADVLELAGDGAKVVNVPRPIVFALGKLSELPFGALGRTSPVALYRMQSALARLHYDSDRARALLGWQPRVGVREGIRRVTSV